jgi:hypothetical protein
MGSKSVEMAMLIIRYVLKLTKSVLLMISELRAVLPLQDLNRFDFQMGQQLPSLPKEVVFL